MRTKELKKRYPDNWQFISSYIKFERAKNRCEQCGIQNGLIIKRKKHSNFYELTFGELEELQQFMDCNKLNEKSALKRLGLTRIHLSVAHLDHNEKNNEYSNLKCMCQRCHLLYDRANNLQRIRYRNVPKLPFPDSAD